MVVGVKIIMSKNRIILIIIFLTFLFVSKSYASSSFRCKNKIISVGDHKGEIQSLCGPPAFIDQHQEERIVKTYIKIKKDPDDKMEETKRKDRDGHNRDFGQAFERNYGFVDEQKFLINQEEWTYNLGPHRFIRTLVFENSKLISVDTGGYGYDEDKTGQSSAEIGDSKAVVVMKYGRPTYTDEHQEVEANTINREDESYFYVEECNKYINVDEWTYDFGPRRLTQRLLFKNNKLVDIDY